MLDYASKYMNRISDYRNPNVKKILEIKRKEIHFMNQSIIREETEKMSSYYGEKSSEMISNNSSNGSEEDEKEKEDIALRNIAQMINK